MTTKHPFLLLPPRLFVPMNKLLGICFVVLFSLFFSKSYAQVATDYRSVATGNWNALTTWQTYNGTAWVAATVTPTAANANVITISVGNTVTQNIATLSVDQVIVNGTMQTMTTAALGSFTVANGAGVDLTINGTFSDLFTTGVITWAGTWQFGATGTLLKTTASSSNTWQSSYNGGASTIPATSNWILRKVGAANPVLTTIGAYYGNLTIENNVAGIWNTAAGSTFQGAGGFPTIKGNFDLGGAGTSTVNFLNQHTAASPTLVQGNVLIRAGNIFANNGTGIEVQGNTTVSGTISYGAANTRGITFSGANAQTISGAGTLNIFNLTMNKSSNTLTLNRAITIDNILTLTSGLIISTTANLPTLNSAASVTGASNTSFVSGPIRYVGSSALVFPVGKGTDYQPLQVSASVSGGTFWTETFTNGCASNCLATSYTTGPNGAWTVASTGTNDPEGSVWYISCAENGNAAGACGTGCVAADASLHVSSNPIWAGDLGAAYEIGGVCPSFGWCFTANIRAESPTINCTGKTGITLAFNYIEYGDGANDDATLWYFDGAAWSLLLNLPKTLCCGGACNAGSFQGLWTAYSIALPASANNNPLVKIGFNWTNNDDGVGWDPSIAVDDITLGTAAGPVVDFTAEYFPANPQTTFNNVIVPSLNHISMCEYWTLTRNAGTENKNVTLAWDANSCGVTLMSDLRVAHWDGATWQNEGNTATSGTTTAGTVTSGVVTWFSPFTLASVSTQNPLPIELLDFTAIYNGNEVDVKWTTATEINNDFFTVERSADANEYNTIAILDGAGNSISNINYSTLDASPLSGLSYYRLKQTDFDGNFSYSNIVPIEIEKNNFEIVNTFNSIEQNMLEITLNCTGNCLINFELYDMIGKNVYSSVVDATGKSIKIDVPTNTLSKGIYMLKAFNGNKIISKKIKL